MNLSSKVIKAENTKIVDSKKKTTAKFIQIDMTSGGKGSVEQHHDDGAAGGASINERIKNAANEAYHKGYSAGLHEGGTREKQKLSLALASVEKLTKTLQSLKTELLAKFEADILGLSVAIAEKVIHKEVSINRDVIVAVLKDTLRNFRDKESIRIRLNPDDYNYITEIKPEFLNNNFDMTGIRFEVDGEIQRGGAIIETNFKEMDVQIDQQLQRIRESLPLR
jgi:flagellar assembly protein FliH